ncbi:hypothetical protein IEQ34_002873 [Dendrobium chrysotoxum]|uniref:Uncharacterized protein n=1 Tax=Dendrobium chrysotoxum TaxID=161865 RepID=A0AAV7HKK7_DENCH|nr:hypothetical protein IEQ34_002873 [Dendrobium chrysotoxum]
MHKTITIVRDDPAIVQDDDGLPQAAGLRVLRWPGLNLAKIMKMSMKHLSHLDLTILNEIKEIKIFCYLQRIVNKVVGIYKIILKYILNMTLYVIPYGRNSKVDSILNFTKELASLKEDFIQIKIQDR